MLVPFSYYLRVIYLDLFQNVLRMNNAINVNFLCLSKNTAIPILPALVFFNRSDGIFSASWSFNITQFSWLLNCLAKILPLSILHKTLIN